MAFPLLQLQVRKAATASYEVWTLPQLGINNFSVSQPFWGFSLGICGLWGAWDSGADLCKLQRSPSYLILPPCHLAKSQNIQQVTRKSQA